MKDTVWIVLGLAAAGGAIWYFSKKKGLPPLSPDAGQPPQALPSAPAAMLPEPSYTTPSIVVSTPEQQEAARTMQQIVQMAELSKVSTQPANLAPPPSPIPSKAQILSRAEALKEKVLSQFLKN